MRSRPTFLHSVSDRHDRAVVAGQLTPCAKIDRVRLRLMRD
jgi:hypothetical protein